MLHRVRTAFDKLRFCLRVAADPVTAGRLLLNTKRFAALGSAPPPAHDPPVAYRLRLGGAVQPVYLRTYAGDLAIFYEVFWRGGYRLPLPPGAAVRTVVDVGANVGLAALDFLARFPQARVICLEPEPANAALLTQNLAPYLASGRAVVEQAALANTDTHVSMQRPGYAYNARVSPQPGPVQVPAYSLATVLRRHHLPRLDLLKIDVEDYEQVIFAAHTDWLAQVEHLVIEIHSPESHAVTLRALHQHGLHAVRLAGSSPTDGIFWAARP